MPLHEKIKERWPEWVLRTHAGHGDVTVVLKREGLRVIAQTLKQDADWSMEVLLDLTAVDGLDLGWKPRFEGVYHFYSVSKNERLRLKVPVDEKDAVLPTLADLWPVADWFEREVWDMFGIRFEGHPDLKRILMYESFEGHPLRKDYPFNHRQPLIGPKN